MFDLDKYKEIWETLSRNKRRSILTGFGVLWGIFMYIVMMGVGNGFQNGMNTIFSEITPNALFLFPNQTSVEYKGFNSGRLWQMSNDDVTAIRQNIPEIEFVSGLLQKGGENLTVRGEKSGNYTINGIENSYSHINPMPLSHGRYFNDLDIKEKRKMCIIGNHIYEELFNEGEYPVGKRIAVDGVYYTVVGVVNPSGNISLGSDGRETVYIPSTTFQQVYNYGKNVDMMLMSAYDNIDIKKVEKKVSAMIKSRHYIAPEDDMAMISFNVDEIFRMFRYLFIGLKILIWVVGMGTMLAGVVGVSNIMLVSIKERTKEIGIKRALGAKPLVILKQIVSESMVLTFIAGFMGLFLGILVLFAVDKSVTDNLFFQNPYISFTLAIVSSLIILLSGALAGIIPARGALKVKAIDAIREE